MISIKELKIKVFRVVFFFFLVDLAKRRMLFKTIPFSCCWKLSLP